MEPRRARMRGVRVPHRRTAQTAHPLLRGVRGGVRGRRGQLRAVGAPVTGRDPGRGVRPNGEPSQRRRTAPPLKPAGRLSRYPTRTPSAVSGHVLTRIGRPAGRSVPLLARQRSVAEASHRQSSLFLRTDEGSWLVPRPPAGEASAIPCWRPNNAGSLPAFAASTPPASWPSPSLAHEREWPIPPERAQDDAWGVLVGPPSGAGGRSSMEQEHAAAAPLRPGSAPQPSAPRARRDH